MRLDRCLSNPQSGQAMFQSCAGSILRRRTTVTGIRGPSFRTSIKPDWYPGNSKCDIATIDYYGSQGDHGPAKDQWNSLYSVTGGQRLLGLAEVGSIPDPDQMTSSGALWSFWMVWSGTFISGGGYNSVSYIQQVMANSKILSVDRPNKLGNWKGGAAAPGTTAPPATTTKPATTTSKPTVTTTTKAVSTTTASTGTTVAQYGQCGGSGWTGATKCAAPYTCQVQNQYYSQCL